MPSKAKQSKAKQKQRESTCHLPTPPLNVRFLGEHSYSYPDSKMFAVQSFWQRHCESSYDECILTARRPSILKPSRLTQAFSLSCLASLQMTSVTETKADGQFTIQWRVEC